MITIPGILSDRQPLVDAVRLFDREWYGYFSRAFSAIKSNFDELDVIGDYLENVREIATALALTDGVTVDVASIPLTAGDWDVSGAVATPFAGTTTVSSVIAAISNTSATLPTSVVGRATPMMMPTAGNTVSGIPITNIATVRFNVAVPTTVFLVVRANFQVSTGSAYGWISARLAR